MTFELLKLKIGDIKQKEWHQHKNGGGWVKNGCRVEESAFIGENAIVFSCHAISGDAWVSGGAQVSGDARVYGNARVSGGAWEKSPLFIIGTKHSLTNCKKGHIQIGCHCKKIDWWMKNFEDIGKKEGYTSEEIAEYGEYIKLFKEIGK